MLRQPVNSSGTAAASRCSQTTVSVIRAKGMCYFTDEYDVCYVFEQAGRQISMRNAGRWFATMPEDELQQMMVTEPTLQRDWDPVYGDRMQKLVFIGRNMDKKAICDALDECLLY